MHALTFTGNMFIPSNEKIKGTMMTLWFVILLAVITDRTRVSGQSPPTLVTDSDTRLPLETFAASNSTNLVTVDSSQENVKKYKLSRTLQASSNCVIDNYIRGMGFEDNVVENDERFISPDSSGAAGAERLVAVVNAMIEVRGKNGTLIYRDGFKDFFRFLAPRN